MSTNISKQKREDLLAKIKEIRNYIAATPQDENTGNLLTYLSELEKDVNGKKYGLVFEEHCEEIDEMLDTHTSVLTEDKELFIDNGGQMNFLIEDIENPNAEPIAVIIKQAVATGWDCPRAQILVKLRDNMSEVFEIQTIGRIRRMPEAKHYESDLLDSCYLYTLDEKFTESVKLSFGKGALDAYKVFLKPEHRSFTLISEYKTDIPYPRDAKLSLKVIHKYFEKKYHITGDTAKNKALLSQ